MTLAITASPPVRRQSSPQIEEDHPGFRKRHLASDLVDRIGGHLSRYGRRVSDRRAPGLTPELVVWQVVQRVFGPLHPDRIGAVLDYHGLNGRPADHLAVLAARHCVSVRTVSGWVKQVRAAGGVRLDSQVIARATRNSRPTEDHLGRVRIAATLHLPAPPPAAPPVQRIGPAQLAVGRAGIRLLATAGPLDVDSLLTAIGRCRRFRVRNPLTRTGLVAALDALGATRGAAGCWRAPAGVTAPARYQSIVRAAAGATHTRQEMIAILIAAGYSPNSAIGRMSTSHPLFKRTGPDRYAIIGSPPRVR